MRQQQNYVTPKKSLGQHFLTDLQIAEDISNALIFHNGYKNVLEIGPGTGVLTDFMIKKDDIDFEVIEIDKESIIYLKRKYPSLKVIEGDFLNPSTTDIFKNKMGIIGNFPYNISSQIFFKVLEYKENIEEVVCMLQKEVAERLSSPPGGKEYGILSVLLQAYYDVEYLFTVPPHVFNPPPKVNSGVIRAKRNKVDKLNCDEVLFKKIVKQSFSMRRKTLRNALKPLNLPKEIMDDSFFDKRAEVLSVQDYVNLTIQFNPYLVK